PPPCTPRLLPTATARSKSATRRLQNWTRPPQTATASLAGHGRWGSASSLAAGRSPSPAAPAAAPPRSRCTDLTFRSGLDDVRFVAALIDWLGGGRRARRGGGRLRPGIPPSG